MNYTHEYEWLIIGSGPGGGVTAHTLAEKYGDRVALLEVGPDPKYEKVTPHSLKELRLWYKAAGLNFAWTPQPLLIGEASVLGGGSQINTGIYHSLPEDKRQNWEEEFQVQSFSEKELSHHRNWVEEKLELQDSHQGHTLLQALKEASAKNHYTAHAPRVWWKDQKRWSLRSTLLQEAEDHGLQIFTKTKAVQIYKQGSLWKVITQKKEKFLCRNLVIAAGALETPSLLQGFISHKKGTSFHLQLRMLAHFPQYQDMDLDDIPSLQIDTAEGKLGFSPRKTNVLCSLLADSPEIIPEVLVSPREYFSFYMTPKIQASITTLPLLGRCVKFSAHDKELALSSLKTLEKFLLAAGAQRTLALGKGAEWNRLPAKFEHLKKSTVHLMGGLGMGESQNSACDSFGRVKNTDRLYVADASLCNGSLGVNPQGSIMLLARRNVLHWV